MAGSNFTAHISLRMGGAGCHCPPFSHALVGVLWLVMEGSSFTVHVSLSGDKAG